MSVAIGIGLWCAIGPGGALDLRTVSPTPIQTANALRTYRGDEGLALWRITVVELEPSGPQLDPRRVISEMMGG